MTSWTAPTLAQTGPIRRIRRLQTESWALVGIALVGTVGLAVISFILSFDAMLIVASWSHAAPAWRWCVPASIDGGIVVYSVIGYVRRGRGETARFADFMLAFLTTVSFLANASAAWAAGDPSHWTTWAGTAVAALPPIGVFAATHASASIAIAKRGPCQVQVEDQTDVDVAPPLDQRITVDQPRPEIIAEQLAATSEVDTTEDRDRMIEELTAAGMSQRAIATRTGASKSTVARTQDRLHLVRTTSESTPDSTARPPGPLQSSLVGQ
ncbi:DUF2637 domain-containing protein [Planctomonas sp. JC2975]|uniref:DUF2637 domain-containing protein n=1 Tax=Planctomonas sp. JC2975 TaxID=2729626 RepID=UPI001474F594|nr:DUF2637 domain-containing protein [Planctomonas sp. JC2975]NNC14063.1 DUF2637 domain-containing protein [Planctomonas sp. JC2975]